MTDDGAGNPRFAFIPKSTWDLLLDLAPIPLACIAVWFSLQVVARLVCILFCATNEYGPLGFAFASPDGIPTIFAGATGIYFLLAAICRQRERTGAMACEGFGRSALLVFPGTIIILLLLTFWCLDAQLAHLTAKASAGQIKWFATNSICLGGAWSAGIVTALALRRLGKRFEVICLLPPVASIAAMLGIPLANSSATQVAQEVAELFSFRSCPESLFIVVAIFLTACILPAAIWAERRLFRSNQRAVGIACAGLWVIATAMSARWISFTSLMGPWNCPIDFEAYFVIGIPLAFFLAACIRLWVCYRRRAAMAAAKPADD